MSVTVDDADVGLGVEDNDRIPDEIAPEPVVVVERQDVPSPGQGDPRVTRGREPQVRLVADEIPETLQRVQDLERLRLPR